MTAAPPKRRVVLAGGGMGAAMAAVLSTAGRVQAGIVITTVGGEYRVAEVLDDSPAPHNRHQRRAALAKRRKRHAD